MAEIAMTWGQRLAVWDGALLIVALGLVGYVVFDAWRERRPLKLEYDEEGLPRWT